MLKITNQQLNTMSRYLLIALFLLAACAQNPAAPEPPSTFAPALRDQPTPAAPPWVEGAEVVTLENAPRIAIIGQLEADTAPSTVFASAFSPDATRLAGLNNEQLIVWDLITGEIVFNTARDQALYVFYGADKIEVYTVDDVGQITIYDADTGAVKDTLETQLPYNGIAAYYADAGWLAIGGLDGSVQVWDAAAKQSLVTFTAGNRPLKTAAFSPDGERLAISIEGNATQVWDWRNKASLATIPETATRLAFSPDGAQLAVGTEEKIDLWNVADSQQQYSLATGPGAITDVLMYSPDGQFLLNGGGIPELTLWDTATGRLVNRLPGVGGDRTSAAFSPEGNLLATSLLGGGVALWDATKLREAELTRADLAVATRQILYADWSGDGHLLLLFDATGPIQVWGIAAQPTPAPG
jgi:WD40 repeat protein